MLLEDCLKEFIFDCKLRKLSERTIKSYRNNNLLMFNYLRKELDIVEVEDVNYKCIQSYIDYLMRKELKESYINGLIKVFRAFFKYAYEEEYIKDKFSYQNEYLFLSQKGKQLTIETVERVVRDCGDGAGIRKDIRCSPPTCRHYYAQA